MTNAEKYRDEIIKPREDGGFTSFCDDFVRPKILKNYGYECSGYDCSDDIHCVQCKAIMVLWLHEEYKEPEADWSSVKVDTPILVSDDKEEWYRRYFAKYENGNVYVWWGGTTSWSARYDDNYSRWDYAKLVEDEDE